MCNFLRKLFAGLLFTVLFFAALELVLHILPQNYWLRILDNAGVAEKEEGKDHPLKQVPIEAERQLSKDSPPIGKGVRSEKVGSVAEAARRSAAISKLPENIPTRGDARFLSAHVPSAKGYHSNEYDEFSVEISINSHGLRDVERPWEKPDGGFRILTLGDSVTEGFQVDLDKTFTKRLEYLLGETSSDYTYDVINAGVSGYSPLIYYLFYTYRLRKYQPDVVVLFVSDEQVLRDNVYQKFAVFDKSGLPTACVHPEMVPESLLNVRYRQLKNRFYSVRFLDTRLNLFWMRLKKPVGSNDALIQEPSTTDFSFSLKLLRALRNECRIDGAELVIVYLPNRSETRRRQLATGGRLGVGVYDTLRLFCEKEGVGYFDLSSVFLSWKGAPLYFEHDGHLTVVGHNAVACHVVEPILEYIKKHKADSLAKKLRLT